MKIGIDARLINETGVGRYIRNLIEQLKRQDLKNHYVIYLPEKSFKEFELPPERWEKRVATPRWHTVWEQCVMPILFLKDNLDLLHVPYFNIPIFYPKKFIVTIHDLTILHFRTGKATTLPYFFYSLRRLGYRVLLELGLRRALAVIVPSKTTKQEIIDHFHIPEKKIHVTYEGVDVSISKIKNKILKIKYIDVPYFLYVGNAYPHKNLERLIEAFADFQNRIKECEKYRLILVGKEDFFYRRLKKLVEDRGLGSSVLFLGEAGDALLQNLYQHASALVVTSLMEGFGLPALEALAHGCTVIASDIPVFREILGDVLKYFDPYNEHALAECLKHPPLRSPSFQEKAAHVVQKYSWQKMAKETLGVYTSVE